MRNLASRIILEQTAITFYDVSDRVKSWGRRGILSGGLVGFALGAVFVAIPHSANVLTFGVIGTLIVGAMEGAVIAGAFGACAAALYSKGALRGRSMAFGRTLSSGRRTPEIGWRDGDIPLSKWPARWTYPDSARPAHALAENIDTGRQSAQGVRQRLNTIDARESGSAAL